MIGPPQSLSIETKTSITSLMDDLSVLSEYTHAEIPKNNVIFCPECWEIPQLSINTSNNKIISYCKENNHHKEYNLNEFCKKCSYHTLSNISCSYCQISFSQEKLNLLDKSNSNNNSPINQNSVFQFLYCEQCKDFFCMKCQKKHLKQKKNHMLIITQKIGVSCLLHNLSYTSYCLTCNKNICLKCVNMHISHKLVPFSKIKPYSQEINQKKMEINRERTELKKVEMVFKDAINQIYVKFNKLMEYKLEELNFKESIIMTYELRNNNLNSIFNFKDLNVNFPKFNYNLFSPNGLNNEDILDDSIGIDKIRNIYEYLQDKKYPILNINSNKKNLNYVINNSYMEEEFIYPKKSNKKDLKNYTYINNDEDSGEENKRYYELAKSLEFRDKKTKKEKKKINNQKIKDNKINHYKINKEEGADNKKFKLIKSRPINSNININEENDISNSLINESDGLINSFPVSKSWVKPYSIKFKNCQKYIPKEERNNKLGDKYLNNIINNKDKFHSQNNNSQDIKNNSYINRYKTKEDENSKSQNDLLRSQEINEIEIKNKIEKNHNFYSKKLGNIIPKFKHSLNLEKRDINKIVIYQPEKIKTIYDNKKEIMNLIVLNDGNFCTSSWDSSIKIFSSETYELLLKINEPKKNDVCYVTQLNDDSLILCSNHIFKYRLSDDDKDYYLETVISGYKDYIIKIIELDDNSLVTCDWEYKIKVWKRIETNENNIQYELFKSNINEGEHLSSLCKLKNNEFISSSNSHLEKGNDVLRFYDKNYNNYKTIHNISCSELVDTLCQIDEQYLCVALQKWSSNQIKGIAIIDLIRKQVINTIQGDSMTCISLINRFDKIIITGGRDKTNKKSLIRGWKLKNNGELFQLYEVCTEQKDAITSIAKLNDGRILASNYDSTIVVLK